MWGSPLVVFTKWREDPTMILVIYPNIGGIQKKHYVRPHFTLTPAKPLTPTFHVMLGTMHVSSDGIVNMHVF